MVELHTGELNGKRVAYSSETEFLVQVGRHARGSYTTRYRFVGDLRAAAFHYDSINVGRGYKKRLLAPSLNKPLLARQWS